MSPLTKNPYTFHRYPNSANRNIKKAIKAIKILTFYQQRRTPWYHVCEKQQRANSGQGWHFCHAQWTSNGYSYFRSSFTTSAFLYLKLPSLFILGGRLQQVLLYDKWLWRTAITVYCPVSGRYQYPASYKNSSFAAPFLVLGKQGNSNESWTFQL